MSMVANEICLKMVGQHIQHNENFLQVFAKAGYNVGILSMDELSQYDRPLDLIDTKENLNNVFLVEFDKSRDDVAKKLETIKSRVSENAAIMLVLNKEADIEEMIFAGSNGVELLNINEPDEELLSRLNSYIHNMLMLKEKSRRKNLRYKINFPVIYSSEGYYRNATGINISRDGVFLITLNPLPEGSICKLIFSLPGLEKRFELKAEVLYAVMLQENKDKIASLSGTGDRTEEKLIHPGMAFYFQNVSEEDKDLISDYIINRMFY